ncbi:MAG: LysM peptidoglycan-binding domain-containing protein [Anaerolineales bacterium]|nr:LysM peptidoglycan-binding domain-containing protein [Anaerolineales bacterium]
MGKKRIILLVTFMLVALLAASCNRPLSEAPAATATSIDNQMSEIFNMGLTETAEAALDGAGGGEAETTPEPTAVVVTNTPEPTVESTAVEVDEIEVPGSYTLHKGEHPFCIARRFDVNAVTLLNYNGLGLNGVFPAGLELRIPSDAPPFAGDRSLLNHPTTYRVQAGDTLYSVACEFGDVSPEQIAQANGKGINWTLPAGENIQIP